MRRNRSMIDLKGKKPFAEGGNRVCYLHPKEKDQCLKLVKQESLHALINSRPWYKLWRSKASFNDNNRDYLGYQQKALKNGKEDIWVHISRCYGFVATSNGVALATELITNNGEPAITLADYLAEYGLTDQIIGALKIFQRWLRKYKVMTKNLLPHNLVLKFQGEHTLLKVIDGLGSQNYLATEFIPFYRDRYIEQRIKYMWMRVCWEVDGRKGCWKKLNQNSMSQIIQLCSP